MCVHWSEINNPWFSHAPATLSSTSLSGSPFDRRIPPPPSISRGGGRGGIGDDEDDVEAEDEEQDVEDEEEEGEDDLDEADYGDMGDEEEVEEGEAEEAVSPASFLVSDDSDPR